jgi:hypothetical protein
MTFWIHRAAASFSLNSVCLCTVALNLKPGHWRQVLYFDISDFRRAQDVSKLNTQREIGRVYSN